MVVSKKKKEMPLLTRFNLDNEIFFLPGKQYIERSKKQKNIA